ncbi:hypothetical protein [Botrimarina sp.]|uniref:hypothetical protein n=1 Tax=Botrimarina sp. TaxID=2795802 RepID=UPI0032ECAE35
MTPVEKLLRDLVGLLEELGEPYAVMGGWAVRAHGLPRPTYDVDVTVAIDREKLPALFQRIDALGYDVGEQYLGGWLDSVADMPLFKASTFVDGRTLVADIFIAENEFQEAIIARRQRGSIDGIPTWLVTPEDLILLKLVADRVRDRADVLDVLTMNVKLDDVYLDHWAERLGVTEKLAAARKEFGESG